MQTGNRLFALVFLSGVFVFEKLLWGVTSFTATIAQAQVTISVAEKFILWALDDEVPDTTPII